MIVLFETFLAFLILAIIAASYSYYKLIGFGIVVSRGSASAIHSLNVVSCLMVSYSFITKCWSVCKKRCSTLLDFKILFHRICGYLILLFSYIHTIGHLAGSFAAISKADLEETNSVLMKKKFTTKPRF